MRDPHASSYPSLKFQSVTRRGMAYTSHGHHIPGTIKKGDRPEFVARCGGTSWCVKCIREAETVPQKDIYKPKHLKEN